MLNLSTILQCKCIFSPKKFVISNKTTTFAVCYYKTQCNISITIKTFATMKQCIKEQIGKLDYETQLRVNETIQALDNGKASSIEFYSDGSGVRFTYWSPTVNHGTPGTIARSFRMNEALLILAGHRLKSCDFPICF